MTQKVLVQLNEKWRVSQDALQWLLQRKTGKDTWNTIHYVATKRSVLERCIREERCMPTEDGRVQLMALPENFKDMANAQS